MAKRRMRKLGSRGFSPNISWERGAWARVWSLAFSTDAYNCPRIRNLCTWFLLTGSFEAVRPFTSIDLRASILARANQLYSAEFVDECQVLAIRSD
jgi:hypothetical protein